VLVHVVVKWQQQQQKNNESFALSEQTDENDYKVLSLTWLLREFQIKAHEKA